jgi:hypothetical protein
VYPRSVATREDLRPISMTRRHPDVRTRHDAAVACLDGLDATSEETALAYPADQAAHDEAFLNAWAADVTPEWFEPLAADGPWEGFA